MLPVALQLWRAAAAGAPVTPESSTIVRQIWRSTEKISGESGLPLASAVSQRCSSCACSALVRNGSARTSAWQLVTASAIVGSDGAGVVVAVGVVAVRLVVVFVVVVWVGPCAVVRVAVVVVRVAGAVVLVVVVSVRVGVAVLRDAVRRCVSVVRVRVVLVRLLVARVVRDCVVAVAVVRVARVRVRVAVVRSRCDLVPLVVVRVPVTVLPVRLDVARVRVVLGAASVWITTVLVPVRDSLRPAAARVPPPPQATSSSPAARMPASGRMRAVRLIAHTLTGCPVARHSPAFRQPRSLRAHSTCEEWLCGRVHAPASPARL
jgi:hypothetical protein